MEWVNVTAKSLPEAIDLALDNLGVDEAEAEIEVLEEPKQGLFGRTRGNARVKARVKPRSSRPKVERGRNRRRRNGGDGSDRGSQGSTSTRSRKDSQSKGRGRSDSKGRGDGDRDGGARNGGGGNGSRTSGQGSRTSGQGSKAKSSNSNRDGRSRQGRQETPAKEASVEEVSAHIESFLSGLTEAFGLTDDVHVDSDGEGGLIGRVEGRHGLLVGPKGRTLDAIQELTRVTAQRGAPSNIRIKVDVGGYRQMRAEALQRFAGEAAAAAKADGKERSLEPMSSADRKVIHDALNEVEGVETRSAGTEPRRRVVVVPTASVTEVEAVDSSEQVEAIDRSVETAEGSDSTGGTEGTDRAEAGDPVDDAGSVDDAETGDSSEDVDSEAVVD